MASRYKKRPFFGGALFYFKEWSVPGGDFLRVGCFFILRIISGVRPRGRAAVIEIRAA